MYKKIAEIIENLNKGANGNWQREGYSFSHEKDKFGLLHIHAHDPQGNMIGEFQFASDHPAAEGGLMPMLAQVDPAHRRKGITSAAYDHAQKISGLPVNPSISQTPDARRFWANRLDKNEITEDLKKGSLQRKIPFNPQSISDEHRMPVEQWTAGGSDANRDVVPELSQNAKFRGMNKLHSKTEVRKHPKTGERMFLLHRGMGPEEHKNIMENKGSQALSSWTPNYSVARVFSEDYNYDSATGKIPKIPIGKVISAWIPESQIHHIPNAIGSKDPAAKGSNPEWDQKSKVKSPARRSEQEVIVKPHKITFASDKHIYNESPSLNQKINTRSGDSFVSDEKRNAKLKQMYSEYNSKKLAASEIFKKRNGYAEMIKSQPEVRFPGFPKVTTRPDQEIRPMATGRQAKIFSKVSAQRAGGSERAKQDSEKQVQSVASDMATGYNARKKGYPSKSFGGVVITTGNDKEASNKPVGAIVPDADQAVKSHEAMHYTLGDLSHKYQIEHNHINKLSEKMSSFLHPEDRAAIEHTLGQYGYKKNSPKWNEETVALARDLLDDPEKKRMAHVDMAHMNANKPNKLDLNRLKKSWRQIIDFTHGLTPENFHGMIGSGEKNE